MLAAEGFGFILVPLLLFVLFAFLAIWKKRAGLFVPAALFALLWIGMMFFFRDPARPQPGVDEIVSPADGQVIQLETGADTGTRLTIFLSLLDVHAIRSPLTGTVIHHEFVPGAFHRADAERAGEENQHTLTVIRHSAGLCTLRAISGMVARRVIVDLEVGEEVLAGQRIGFVRFGSRCEVFLPPGFRSQVMMNDRVVGGVTPLGNFPFDGQQEPLSAALPGSLPWAEELW